MEGIPAEVPFVPFAPEPTVARKGKGQGKGQSNRPKGPQNVSGSHQQKPPRNTAKSASIGTKYEPQVPQAA